MGQSQSSATLGTGHCPERLCLRTQGSCPCLDGLLGVPGATGAWTDRNRHKGALFRAYMNIKEMAWLSFMSALAGCSQRPFSLLVAVLPASTVFFWAPFSSDGL